MYEKRAGLSRHLREAQLGRVDRGNFTVETLVAEGILANPQCHIDALVKAGVLEKAEWASREMGHMSVTQEGRTCYMVTLPHKHSWYLHGLRGSTQVELGCTSLVCDVKVVVPNRVPIEVPKFDEYGFAVP